MEDVPVTCYLTENVESLFFPITYLAKSTLKTKKRTKNCTFIILQHAFSLDVLLLNQFGYLPTMLYILKVCVCYIFASLFFSSKRELLSN